MDILYSPQSRPERLIAAGRVVLAASSLLAVWLDPSEPAKFAHIAYSLLGAYLVYAVAVASLVWRPAPPGRRWRLTTHVFDLLFFSLFVYFTAGPSSPFIAYFVFSLVCGTLRWGWRGTLWTAIAALAAFLGVAVYFAEVVRDPDFELHTSIIRGFYLAVVAALLAYLGVHEERTRREMALLAGWPQQPAPENLESLVGGMLCYAAEILAVPRILIAWTGGEEPQRNLALWQSGELRLEREPPAAAVPRVAAPLAASSFFCADVRRPQESLLGGSSAGPERWRGEPLDPGATGRFGLGAVLSVPLASGGVSGRLFFLDRPAMTADDLLLAEIVAGVAAARLEQHYLTCRLRQAATTEERVRLARDLHDGVLQSFTGFGLRLATVRRQLAQDPAAARRGLETLQQLIALEQRDLRFFIAELKPPGSGGQGDALSLGERLSGLKERIEREWDLEVALAIEGLDGWAAEPLCREIYHLVREALVNAARHGGASEVEVQLAAAAGGGVAISVADNGRGFPFTGRYSDAALARLGVGPRNLRERVAGLKGSLVVDSDRSGARIEVTLPAAEA